MTDGRAQSTTPVTRWPCSSRSTATLSPALRATTSSAPGGHGGKRTSPGSRNAARNAEDGAAPPESRSSPRTIDPTSPHTPAETVEVTTAKHGTLSRPACSTALNHSFRKKRHESHTAPNRRSSRRTALCNLSQVVATKRAFGSLSTCWRMLSRQKGDHTRKTHRSPREYIPLGLLCFSLRVRASR